MPLRKNNENYNYLKYVHFQNELPSLIRIRETAILSPMYVNFYAQNLKCKL